MKGRAQILPVPMASCAQAPPPKCQDSDVRRPMACFPGAYVLCALSWAHVRVWEATGRGCDTGFAGECALCAFFLCKSCFIWDIDLCGPMASLLALHVLRAVCGATRRVLETTDSGRHTPG